MEGHRVKIEHERKDVISITIDDMVMKKVKAFCVNGENGKPPELTITIDADSVVYEKESRR